jgi:hypothetical protein
MSLNGKIVDHGVRLKTKKLKGGSLAEIDAQRKVKGCEPPAGGPRLYAVTRLTVTPKHGGQVRYPGGLIVEDFVVHMKACLAAPEVHVEAETTICVPARLDKLDQAERKEWWRFYKTLERQEQEVVQRGLAEAAAVLADLEAMSVTLQSETVNEDKLREKALGLLKQAAQAEFCSGQIDARLATALDMPDMQPPVFGSSPAPAHA